MAKQDNAVTVASFTDPRITTLSAEGERYIQKTHRKLVAELKREFNVIDPQSRMREKWSGKTAYGISSEKDIARFLRLAQQMSKGMKINAFVIQSAGWTEPFLPMSIAKQLNVPIAVYTPDDPSAAGNVSISSIGASLLEQDNHYFRVHLRTRDVDTLKKWTRAALAYNNLLQSTILFWGDSDCLRMKHLQGDVNQAESIFVYRVAQEGQYRLIKRAEKLLAEKDRRIQNFINRLEKKSNVIYKQGTKLDSRQTLEKQAALYYAARDRLKEFTDEKIAAVSLKCQPELSEDYGYTGCLIPSFLPFKVDRDDEIFPTTCESDFHGTLSVALLKAINPTVPPLFGDFKYIKNGTIYISNCGGASVYYAANSNKLADVLPQITLEGQCQGKMGCAVGYKGKETLLTVLRLYRVRGEYKAQAAVGRGLTITEHPTTWGTMWPTVGIELGVDDEKFVRVAASNHFTATEGDYIDELQFVCRLYGIPVERIDSDAELDTIFENRIYD